MPISGPNTGQTEITYITGSATFPNQSGTIYIQSATFSASITASTQVNITQSIPLVVTSSQANPVYVTGALTFGGTITAINNSVAGVGSPSPLTATLIGGFDDLNNVSMVHVDTNGVMATYTSGTTDVHMTGAMGDLIPGLFTATPLAANTAWTGSWTKTEGYASIAYAIRANTTGTIIRQWSIDGAIPIQWSTDSLGPDRTGSLAGQDMVQRIHAPYYRMIYLNGAGVQTYFTASHTFGRYTPTGDTIGVAHQISDGDDALITKSVLTAKTPTGTYVDIIGDQSGALFIGNTSTNPVWITGVDIQVSIKNSTLNFVEASVGQTGSAAPVSATFVGYKNDAGLLTPFSGTADGRLWVTGNFATSYPSGFNSNITGSITLPVSATNPVTASISNWPAVVTVTSTQTNPVWITGTSLQVTFGNNATLNVTATIGSTVPTGTMAPLTATMVGFVDGAGNLQPATVVSGAQLITGSVGVTNLVSITASTSPATPFWVTGSTGGSSQVGITGSVTLPVSATNPVTASISNFPTQFAVTSTGSFVVTGSVGVNNLVAVTASTSPANPFWVTGSTGGSPNVNITGTITLPVSMTNAVTASVNDAGGSLTVDTGTPGQPLNVTASAGPGTPLWVTHTGSDVITGSVGIVGSVILPVSMTNFVTASISNFPAGFNVTTTGALVVTGAVGVNNIVKITGSAFGDPINPIWVIVSGNMSASFTGTMNVSSTGALVITGSVGVNSMPVVTVTNTGALVVTGTFGSSTAPIWITHTGSDVITGSVGIVGSIVLPVSMTNFVTASISNFPAGFNVTTTGALVVTGTTGGSATPIWVTHTGSDVITGSVGIVGSVTLPVSMTNYISATIVTPVTVTNTGSLVITGSVGVNSMPVVTVTNTGSLVVTGSVGVNNLVTVTASTAPATPFWVTGTIHYDNASSGGGTQYGSGTTSTGAPGLTGTLALGQFSGATNFQALPLKVDSLGQQYVTNTGSLVVTGSVGVNNLVAVTASTTSATPFWVTGSVFVLNPNTTTVNGNISASSTSIILTGALGTAGAIYGYSTDLARWRPIKGEGTDADGEAVIVAASDVPGVLSAESYPKVFNGTSWDRQRGDTAGMWIKTNGATVLAVSQSTAPATPFWVTGTIHYDNASSGGGTQYGTGSAAVLTGTLMLAVSGAGAAMPLSATQLGALYVSATQQNPVWVSITGAIDAVFAGTQNVTGSVFAAQSGAWTTAVTSTGSLVVTGSVGVNNLVAVTMSTAPATPIWGIVTTTGALVVTGTTGGSATPIWTTHTGSDVITGSVGIVGSVVLPVSMTNFVSATIVTPVTVTNTGSLVVTGAVGTFQISSPWIVSNTGSLVVTGSVGVNNLVAVTMSTAPAVPIWSIVTTTGALVVTGTTGGSATPIWTTHTGSDVITGSVGIVGSVTLPVSMTNYISATIVTPVTVTNTGSLVVTGSVGVNNLVAVTASTAPATPFWVTGTIHYDNASSGGGAQYGTGSVGAFTGTLMLGLSGTVSPVARAITIGTGTMASGALVTLPTDQALLVSNTQIDAGNSSTTPLGIGGVFTGVSFDTYNQVAHTVFIFSDQNSATNGISLQWSSNGTNWDETYTDTFTVGGNAFVILTSARGRFFRIVYTNGAVAQTFFRLHVMHKNASNTGDVLEVVDGIANNDHAQLVRSILSVSSTTGGFVTVSGSAQGAMFISSTQAAPVWMTGSVLVLNPGGATNSLFTAVTGVMSATNASVQLTGAIMAAAGNYGYSTDLGGWRPVRVEGTNADGEAVIDPTIQGAGVLGVEAYPKVFNGTTWDRLRGDATGLIVRTTGALVVTGTFGSSATPIWVTSTGALVVTGTTGGSATPLWTTHTGSDVITGSVGVFQISSPWIVSNTGALVVTGAIGVFAAAAPLNVTMSNTPATPLWIANTASFVVTGSVGVNNLVQVTASNTPATALWVQPVDTTTATVTNVQLTGSTSTQLLAANANRMGATIYNNGGGVAGNGTSALYIKFGTAGTLFSYTVRLGGNAYYEVPFGYTGILHGFCSGTATTTLAVMTEITA